FDAPPATDTYTLSLHDALPIFRRAYASDRSDKIWLPEHIAAFMEEADVEMKLAMMLALHTGQRQGDILRMAWSNYDGERLTIRQDRKSTRLNSSHVKISYAVFC